MNKHLSIHAPAMGGDTVRTVGQLVALISIHAPRVGGDSKNVQKHFCEFVLCDKSVQLYTKIQSYCGAFPIICAVYPRFWGANCPGKVGELPLRTQRIRGSSGR